MLTNILNCLSDNGDYHMNTKLQCPVPSSLMPQSERLGCPSDVLGYPIYSPNWPMLNTDKQISMPKMLNNSISQANQLNKL